MRSGDRDRPFGKTSVQAPRACRVLSPTWSPDHALCKMGIAETKSKKDSLILALYFIMNSLGKSRVKSQKKSKSPLRELARYDIFEQLPLWGIF